MPPFVDLGINPLVQVRHRAGADPGALQDFGNILDPAYRYASRIHLDQRLFDRAFPPPVPLDDRRFKSLPPLRDLQADLASLGVQR